MISKIMAQHDMNFSHSVAVPVTVIIAAHNEAKHLQSRIDNIYCSDYPSHMIEVIVASDGSTDRTRQLVSRI